MRLDLHFVTELDIPACSTNRDSKRITAQRLKVSGLDCDCVHSAFKDFKGVQWRSLSSVWVFQPGDPFRRCASTVFLGFDPFASRPCL